VTTIPCAFWSMETYLFRISVLRSLVRAKCAFLLSSEMCPQRRPRNKKRPSRMAKTVHISGEMRRLSKGSAQVFTSAGWHVAQLSPVGTPAVCGKAPDYWLTRHDDTSRT